MSTVYTTSGSPANGVQQESNVVRAHRQFAVLRAQNLAQQAGGVSTGRALLAGGLNMDGTAQYVRQQQPHGSISKCLADPVGRLGCLSNVVANACRVGGDPRECMNAARISSAIAASETNLLKSHLQNPRQHETELYFRRPAPVLQPRFVSKDVAAVSVASANL